MRVLTFRELFHLDAYGKHAVFNPGERLIFDNSAAITLEQKVPHLLYENNDLDPYLEGRKRPEDWRGLKVLFFRRGAGGDQLIASSAVHYFKEVLGAKVYVACEPVLSDFWKPSPDSGPPIRMPVHLDAVWRAKGRAFFDWAFFLESIYEDDMDQEQGNCYDRLFEVMGLDSVPDQYKRPVYHVSRADIDQVRKYVGGDYILIAPLSANSTRSFPLFLIENVLETASMVAMEQGLKLLLCHKEKFSPKLSDLIAKTPRALNVASLTSLRGFSAAIAGARAVIGPDSGCLHFAAAFGTPALGIWGAFDPACRAKYYPQQINLWHQERCRNSPCYYYYRDTLPANKCPKGASQKHCECFEAVQPGEIKTALLELLN